MDVLIKGARIVDWSGDFLGDIYINNGIITEIGENLQKDCETINAQGKVVMPSFIDLHVHFRDPGFTYKEDILTGSKAAVKGGYTAVNLMANTNPICSSMETVKYVLEKAAEIGLVDVHQVVSITKNFDGKTISHLDNLDSTVKIISEDGKDVMNSNVMLNAMVKAKDKKLIVMCHSENGELSSTDMRLAEDTMTWRNITLAKYTGCSIHIAHVSTGESMKYIIDAKKEGYNVTCEVAPHHVALTDDTDYRVNPPIRKKEDMEFIIKAIKEGWVDAIATDHAPHTIEDKINGAPGISGIETAFSICYTKLVKEEKVGLNRLSEIMSKKPAEIMKLNKGQVKIGFDGDLVIIDLDTCYEIDSDCFLSKGKNTPFQGMKVYGRIEKTIKKGEIVYNLESEG